MGTSGARIGLGAAIKRVGLIGFGFIGAQVYRRIVSEPKCGLEVAFVHNRSRVDVPQYLENLGRMPEVDLVVEMAHPQYTREWGERILARANYLPLSVTALADDAVRERLIACAAERGTHLAVPHGALMGLDTLREWRHMWSEVEIAFFKNPANIDFSESGIDAATLRGETVVYEGPVRGIASRFPRNVNTMVTCALATVGLDRCRAKLVSVPGLNVAIAQVSATGRDGSRLAMRKEQPATGVSGTEMFESQFASILRAAGAREVMEFV